MKKVTLTEKQKKVLKITAIVAGGVACAAIGIHVINRTELGAVIKEWAIQNMIQSRMNTNGRRVQMFTCVSKETCPDSAIAEKAFNEAYKVLNQIIQEAKNI